MKLKLGNQTPIFLSSWALVNEACDETRFEKKISGVLNEVRNGIGDGLFTVRYDSVFHLV